MILLLCWLIFVLLNFLVQIPSLSRLIELILTYFYVLICISSQNGKFSYGYASSPGKRSSMEDFYETRIDGVDGEVVGLFGVFDGTFT